jgi:hypothetical protein
MRGRAAPIVARTLTFPSPVGGWNARDAYDAMGPQDAIEMDNIFPGTSECVLRKGSLLQCATGASGAVKTLATWAAGSTAKLLAAAGGHIYNVTTSSPTSLGSGFVSDTWQTTNFATLGGQYTLFFNGVDMPQVFDGTTLTANSTLNKVSGNPYPLTVSNLAAPVMYQARLFVAEAGTLHLWYGNTVGVYQGAVLLPLDLGPLATRGGAIAAVSTWSRTNVYGQPVQLLVVATNQGEIFIFQGTDPSNAATWTLGAQVLTGAPVAGYRSLVPFQSECGLICADGVQPLSQYLFEGQLSAQKTAFTAKIGDAFSLAYQVAGQAQGWSGLLYPLGTRLIFNVPAGDGVTFYQYVMNTITGAWCRFTGWNAWCFGLLNGNLYWGDANGNVFQGDIGTADNGAAIQFNLKTGFRKAGGGGQMCRFTMIRPVVTSPSNVKMEVGCNVDFNDDPPGSPLSAPPSQSLGILVWGQGYWGQALWGGSPYVQRNWQSVTGLGYIVAARITGSVQASMSVHAIDVMYEAGGYL